MLCLNNSIIIELSAIVNIEYYTYVGFLNIAQKHDYYVKQTKTNINHTTTQCTVYNGK